MTSSSYINHFLQPDSVIPDWTNPQTLNRYAYTLGNPVRYNDPSGHDVGCPGDNDCNPNTPPAGGSSTPITPVGSGIGTSTPTPTSTSSPIVSNMMYLGIYGEGHERDAVAYLVEMEFNNGIVNEFVATSRGWQGYDLLQGMRNRYAEYCDDGVWSLNCVDNFWGYHEPILNQDTPHSSDYYNDKQDQFIQQFVSSILSANQDLSAGCASGSANICHYALAKPDLITWGQSRAMNLNAPSSTWHQDYAPNEILHIYNNADSYFATMSQAFYQSLFNLNGPNYCPFCVH